MMTDVKVSPFTAHESAPLKHAAIGAARSATESGKAALAARLMERAREYNRTIRREHRASIVARKSGEKFTPAPPLPIPEPEKMTDVRLADVKDTVLIEIVKELARMGKLSDWRIVGTASGTGQPFRPLVARKDGEKIRYMAVPAPEPEKKRPAPASKKKQPDSARPKVEPTKVADLPEEVRAMALAAKEAGSVGSEWSPLGSIVWDGQDVKVFARTHGRSLRYGIAA